MGVETNTRLSWRTKLIYGLGRSAEGIKARAFEFFLFFYYVQVLGLSGSLAGLAVGIALIFDAVIDPLIGSYSDNLQSRYGRRHPLMYASIPPLAITFYFLFDPPEGLDAIGLFIWLTGFSILSRGAIALYHVPHLSLGAELSSQLYRALQYRCHSHRVRSVRFDWVFACGDELLFFAKCGIRQRAT